MEIAGLALGATSLISLYSTCLQGYISIRSARSLGKDATTLLCQLEIEEARFITWGASVGLLQVTGGEETQHVNIDLWQARAVAAVLGEIASIICDTKELRKRYNIVLESFDASENDGSLVQSTQPSMAGVFSHRLSDLFLREQTRRADMATSIQRGTSIIKKLRWISTDKDTFTSLISALHVYNDSLGSMLNSTTQRRFHQFFQDFCLESSKTNDLERLKTIETASMQQCKQLALPAGHKLVRLHLEHDFAQNSVDPSPVSDEGVNDDYPSLRLAPTQVYIDTPSASRSLGLYRSKQVLVEWRTLQIDTNAIMSPDKLVQRLEMFSRLLHGSTPRPPEFRSLTCVGYLLKEDPYRFAFVFNVSDLPSPSYSLKSTPDSLLDILSDEDGKKSKPTQGARFMLAKRLATSILYLHSTGWLHKGFRSDNILALGTGDKTSYSSISSLVEEPFLVGHGYARLSSNIAGSEPVDNDPLNAQYRHPDVLGEPRATFQKEHDVYSLGAVLMEIAYWKPLSKILGPARRTSAENRQKLIRLVESGDVAHWMGSIYSDVVEACLSCRWLEKDLEMEFSERVVRKLELCVV
ncbi:prion-inhibition and propagation-domain-containing protein [Leptodontidium sp. 2 PMI_412]|nr:prion-inhibition and propagation-domain-containing protein [Leptodontidium sp. 2 PMI_412]